MTAFFFSAVRAGFLAMLCRRPIALLQEFVQHATEIQAAASTSEKRQRQHDEQHDLLRIKTATYFPGIAALGSFYVRRLAFRLRVVFFRQQGFQLVGGRSRPAGRRHGQ